jgi:CubicO group peptidase (beta-lactamase class C family)
VGIDSGALAGLLTRARREIDEGLLPACQIAVAKDGKLVAFETFGSATNDNRFLVFSCTKGFVAAAVWLLLGSRDLRLQQRVAELVPEFGEGGKDVITVEQVLRHIAGFPNAFLNPMEWDDRQRRLATFAEWKLEWEPGSRYAYHALSGAWVLAELIERCSGDDFRTFIAQRVVQPLGLPSFRLGCPVEEQSDVLDAVLCGEHVTADELMAAWGIPEVPPDWLQQSLLLFLNDPGVRAIGIPAGGAVSNAADIAMFYQAVLENRLWDAEVLREAVSDARTYPDGLGIQTTRGLGVQINGDHEFGWWYGFGKGNSPRAFGHDGAGSQIAWANPDNGLSFCYLTNGLDENMVRQKRRMLAIGSRAAKLVAK